MSEMSFSASAVLQRMRESLKNDANRMEGGFCMDNLQAVAEEISRLDTMEVMPIPDRVLLDTAEGEFLDRKALDYNEARNPATAATGILLFTGDVGAAIPQGTGALYGALVFETTAPARIGTDGTCQVGAACLTEGPAGNAPAGAITALQASVDGVKSVTNPQPFGGGTGAESDDSFRQRIFDKIRRPITSGNRNHFIYWAKQVSGVGGAKCLGAEVCGAGKVKVIVLSDQYKAPDNVVLENVKAHIEEERQIGADVTVAGAAPKAAHIVVEVQAAPGYNIADIRQNAILEPLGHRIDQGESRPCRPWAGPKRRTSAAVALPDELVEVPRPEDGVLVVATGKPSLEGVEILPGVEDVSQGLLQLLRVLTNHAEKVDKIGVEIVVNLLDRALLVQQDGGPAAEHLHIGPLPVVCGEPADNCPT